MTRKATTFCQTLKEMIAEEQDAGEKYRAFAKKAKYAHLGKEIEKIARQEEAHKKRLATMYQVHCELGPSMHRKLKVKK